MLKSTELNTKKLSYIISNYLSSFSTHRKDKRRGDFFFFHLKLFFFGLLALLPQRRKALSRVFTISSCSSFLGSRSSTHVISWLSRWRRTSLLPVDCVALLERLSERTRPMVPNNRLISSILAQSVKCSKVCCLLERLNVEVIKYERTKYFPKGPKIVGSVPV